ncbi:MAG: pyridoxamine kinase [Ruminococcaceae bacterium]|nr:pyridoxamine kinase [Oscillospiraceae bacterium]
MSQKRVAAIHDISGFGKCSLTVALPLISAAGIETAVIPTAVLSTHTGGFEGYTFRDLTDDIMPIVEHWKQNNLQFDAVYSGYLGSNRQVDIVIKALKLLKNENTKFICDPAMADHGKLYAGFDKKFPRDMFKLCHNADIIVPNITEAVFMLGEDYKAGPYTKEYIGSLVISLYEKTGAMVVLTGVYFDEKRLGAACFDGTKISYIMGEKIDAVFHGTGDVFASVLTAGIITGRSLVSATEIAVKFTCDCIKATLENDPDRHYGVNFETEIPKLIKYLGIDYEG